MHALVVTSSDLQRLGIVDEVIPEPLGGAHRDHRQMAVTLQASLVRALKALASMPIPELLDRRYEKFRRFGVFEEMEAGEPDANQAAEPAGRPAVDA